MRKPLGVVLALVIAAAAPWTVGAEDAAQGPAEAIAARKSLMQSIEELLSQLESDVGNGVLSPDQLVVSSGAIASALEAFPLLFPPDSDLLLGTGTTIEGVTTSADPGIWIEFEMFRDLSLAAARTARQAPLGNPNTATSSVRGTCEGCHAQYLFYDPFEQPGN